VLLGSTGKMGTGMNVQQRLIALHNLDCPWRPGDLEQRHGRILRQGNQWPQVYLFSYIAEGSFDAYQYQLIESKARFIEQALAGEITARTAEDTSDVVLSAAEIKAIASGNPQIVRKVQLEAEVARLERVRGVWLDTRRNLQLERHFTEEEIHRAEGRRAQWERAATLVAAHPHEPFYAEVAAAVNSETFQAMTTRAEAGAAVRRLVHDYQSTAAFQRQRLRGVVARYRGLNLVVQAHAVFAADLSLALPDGITLDTVNASTDTGVWQSVGRTVSEISNVLTRLQGRLAEAHERIASIDRELARLANWDGQKTYDTAMSELSAINAVFAAEEQSSPERSEAAVTEGVSRPVSDVPLEEIALADVLLALTQEERAAEGWSDWTTVIPPAPVSLAWMSVEVERLATQLSPRLEPLVAEEPEAEGALLLATEVGRACTPSSARFQFGDALVQRRAPKPEAPRPAHTEAEVSQLPLF
jgi:hypothetical protein